MFPGERSSATFLNRDSDFHEIVQRYFTVEPRGEPCAVVRTTTQPWFVWWSRKDDDHRFKASTTVVEHQLPYRYTIASHSLHRLCKAILRFPKSTKHVEARRRELRASDVVQEVDPVRKRWIFKDRLLGVVIADFDLPKK